MDKTPFSFDDSSANNLAKNLGRQWAKHILKKAKSPNSLQSRTNAQLDFAAKSAPYRYAHIIEANKQAAKAEKDAAKAAETAKATKVKRANATRRANTEHKAKIARMSEIEDLKTSKQVERVKAVNEAKAAGKPPGAPKAATPKTSPTQTTSKPSGKP
jgi:hypothetical protein